MNALALASTASISSKEPFLTKGLLCSEGGGDGGGGVLKELLKTNSK